MEPKAHARPPHGALPVRLARSHALRRLEAAFAAAPCAFTITVPGGPDLRFGQGAPAFRIVLKAPATLALLATLDEGRIADAYIAGAFDVEGSMSSLMQLRASFNDWHPLSNLRRFADALLFGQVRANARAIEVHYDLAPDFFLSFLGEMRCYTQGMFESDDEPLGVAVRRKFDYCLRDCRIDPGSHMLDVGIGWGGWAAYAARRGVHVTGLTISETSRHFLQGRGRPADVEWEIVAEDVLAYRPPRRFDSVVVMGVMEHLPNYARVLDRLLQLVKPGGRIYIDASAQRVKYQASSFIYRHVYPGNHSFLDLADFLRALARTPFRLRSVADDRHSYHLTFTHWALNFEAARARIVRDFGEHNFRRFQLYLWGAAHAFAADVLQCYRLVLESPA